MQVNFCYFSRSIRSADDVHVVQGSEEEVVRYERRAQLLLRQQCNDRVTTRFDHHGSILRNHRARKGMRVQSYEVCKGCQHIQQCLKKQTFDLYMENFSLLQIMFMYVDNNRSSGLTKLSVRVKRQEIFSLTCARSD